MRTSTALRLLAAFCLVISFPTASLKLPWLPVTVLELRQTYRDLRIPGTGSYVQNRQRNLVRCWIALGLYSTGLVALGGWCGIALGGCRRGGQIVAWCASLITGAGLPIFDYSRINPHTSGAYVAMMIYIPLIIALLSIAGLVMTLLTARGQMPPD